MSATPNWERLGLSRTEWRQLAGAFYALAHGVDKEFTALPESLKGHPAGQLCAEYIRTGERATLDRAGHALTGTKEWYVYLGRSM